MLSGNIDFSRLGMKNLSFHQNKRLLSWFSLQPSLYSYTILSAMASLTDQVNQELEVSQLIGQHEVHPPSLLARGWCWCPCPSWCAGSLHRSSLLSLKKDENRVKTNFRTKKSWTYSRPSSAGRTWAWSPCRGGRRGRAGGGWRGGGTTLPAAQKASSELHFKPHQCTRSIREPDFQVL